MALLLFAMFWFSLPDPLFDKPVCKIIEASNGQLLGAKIAKDGQWRFPNDGIVPEKFSQSIISFEDKRFYNHCGVDILAMGRAVSQNFKNRKIVSGGSTLSMQVMRLARNGKPRTIYQKLIEIILTLRLELKYSKQEILSFYTANAPFGGNVVGLEAASWRYFGKKPALLSWSETATLAVLPNSPSMIHPGKNREALKAKRDRLLQILFDRGLLDRQDYMLAVEEPLPEKPYPLPQLAPHLLEKLALQKPQYRQTTINWDMQQKLIQVSNRHNQLLKNNEIHNLAIIVIDVEKKQVVGYVGNAPNAGVEHGESVDIVQAPRSTGSILKPLLYAMANKEGMLLPKALVPDIPIYFQDFRPENYSKTYEGVVPANDALSKSLNVPFVKMLQAYGVDKFHFGLKKHGISTLKKGPNHYGLSLILGGAEATLWDLTNIYASMAKRLNNIYPYSGRYDENDFMKADFYPQKKNNRGQEIELSKTTNYLTADAIWITFNAMTALERPDDQGDWLRFETKQKIAWKTGTSFGFRDAWAIGVNTKYAVGVWVGNADGEGRPGLIGVRAAAPILFEIFDYLPMSQWFIPPFDELKFVSTCQQSGYLAKEGCRIDSVWVCNAAFQSPSCPYHQKIHLDKTEMWQVNKDCYSSDLSSSTYWFVLPVLEEFYYKPKHPSYQSLPPFLEGCNPQPSANKNPLQLEYPSFAAQIYVPIELNGQNSRTIFKAVHKNASAIIYWHIDHQYLGSTKEFHSIEVSPAVGKHMLTIVDNEGNWLEQKFQILSKE